MTYMRKWVIYIPELPDIEEQGTEFRFRKLEFNTIYNTYVKKSPFKYYISILGGVWGPAYFAYLRGWMGVQNLGKPAYIILARSLRVGSVLVFFFICWLLNRWKDELLKWWKDDPMPKWKVVHLYPFIWFVHLMLVYVLARHQNERTHLG